MMETIMFQATASGAGKSTLVAALCSALRREGYSVAPFKTQNMSLNSYVANRGGPNDEGGEMAVAQAVQAIAAGEEPSVDMNPILLKPRGNLTSSLVINGKWVGDYSVNSYYDEVVKTGLKIASEAINRLKGHDFLVLEGAGSPAEINLYDRDIANMRTAELANSPVIIIGDIERGGVFASLYGTYSLLREDWKKYVKGFIINKMGGDPSLLGDGPSKLTGMTGVPVLGVLPYSEGLQSWWEDSLDVKGWGKGPIEVAVIDYPGASIMTDLEPLRYETDVKLKLVKDPREIGEPDIVVLPGSKSTRSDLRWMREKGLDETVRALHREGKVVVGICGGAQMLGSSLNDPMGYEGEAPGESPGLGLLPHTTTFSDEKVVRRVKVTYASGLTVTVDGFEIHKGRVDWNADWKVGGGRPLFTMADGSPEGFAGRNVYATLVHHAFFYNDALRRDLLNEIRKSKGLPQENAAPPTNPLTGVIASVLKAEQLLRESGTLDKIMEVIEAGLPRHPSEIEGCGRLPHHNSDSCPRTRLHRVLPVSARRRRARLRSLSLFLSRPRNATAGGRFDFGLRPRGSGGI